MVCWSLLLSTFLDFTRLVCVYFKRLITANIIKIKNLTIVGI